MNPHSNVLSKLQSRAASQPRSLFLTPLQWVPNNITSLSLTPEFVDPDSRNAGMPLFFSLCLSGSCFCPCLVGYMLKRICRSLCSVLIWFFTQRSIFFFGTKIAWICSSSALQWVSAHCSAASLQLNCFRFTLSALMFSATAGACVFLRNSSRISTWQTQLELESW